MQSMRIARYLANAGLASRRKSEELILQGKISVNNKVIKDLSFKINPEIDVVKYNNEVVKLEEKVYYVLNKPPGFLCTVKDNFNRKTILDILDRKDKNERLYPVGRLDYNSRGLMFLTNDGDFAYKLTHPKFEIPKTYEIILDREIDGKLLDKIKNGVYIDNVKLKVANITKENIPFKKSKIVITIFEGRKRVLRTLFKNLGFNVIDLKRVQIGNFKLENLKEGSYRKLNKSEIKSIYPRDLETSKIP